MAPASNRDVQRHLESVEYPSSRRIWSQASTRRSDRYSASFGTGLSNTGRWEKAIGEVESRHGLR
jgi:hypothetical protein